TATDAYWNSRPADARLAAIASEQTRPIVSRAALVARLEEARRRFTDEVPRPERWIGYRVWAERVELWTSQPARLHDRACWPRAPPRRGAGCTGRPGAPTRLQP